MKLGFIGLGKMGTQMVIKLIQNNHDVVVYDLNKSAIEYLENKGAVGSKSVIDLISKLPKEKIIWLMIQQQYVGNEIESLKKVLPPHSIIIDGGNSDFRKSIERGRLLQNNGINFIDIGVSGGILGLRDGFSMMVGGAKTAFRKIEPIIKSLSKPNGYAYFGDCGSGHYIKMVHNAIEYGLMESYAEGYHLLKDGPIEGIDIPLVAQVWQNGSIIDSKLNGLVSDILKKDPTLKDSSGYVEESGEARWAIDVARKSGVEMPVIIDSLNVRFGSQKGSVTYATKLLAMMRNFFGGHKIN